MNTFGQFRAMRGAEQVKISGVVPVPHDGEPVEQRHIVLLRHDANTIQVWRRRNHRLRARTVLQIDQNHVDPGLLQRSNSFADSTAKIIGIDGSHSIDRPGLPDDQSRSFCLHQLNEVTGHVLGGLPGL